MAVSIDGTNIIVTQGDTLKVNVSIKNNKGDDYVPQEGDVIRFALKKNYLDADTLINKVIPNESLLLRLEAEETKQLPIGSYVYDIQITFANGDVDTFINKAKMTITEEVD